MFGALRLALAMIVATFHFGISIDGMAGGIGAVVVFYMISGYAMTGLLERGFSGATGVGRPAFGLPVGLGRFYRDRALRLLPQYWFWFAASACAIFGFHLQLYHFPVRPPGPVELIAAITVVPLDLAFVVTRLSSFMLIPPSWSLSIELCFYLVFPFLFTSRRMMWLAAVVGMTVFVLGATAAIPSGLFEYSMLPGPIVFFVLGHAIYRRDLALGGFLLAGLALGSGYARSHGVAPIWNQPIAAGWIIGAPLVLLLSYLRPRRWDSLLGNASYGCYLAHWLLLSFFAGDIGRLDVGWAVAALAAVAGLAAHYAIERPIDALRRRLRRVPRRATPAAMPAMRLVNS